MIPALWFTGGAACASGMIWLGWWMLFAPIEPIEPMRKPRELGPGGYGHPYGEL